jgi:hypothetical protein
VGPKSQKERGGGTARLADGSRGAADGASWIGGAETMRGERESSVQGSGRWKQGTADGGELGRCGPSEGNRPQGKGKERGCRWVAG